jgi:hypothetical protein
LEYERDASGRPRKNETVGACGTFFSLVARLQELALKRHAAPFCTLTNAQVLVTEPESALPRQKKGGIVFYGFNRAGMGALSGEGLDVKKLQPNRTSSVFIEENCLAVLGWLTHRFRHVFESDIEVALGAKVDGHNFSGKLHPVPGFDLS